MDILKLILNSGFRIFERPYELNIVGLRSRKSRPKKFDDWIYVFYKDHFGKWIYHEFKATTDPGRYYLNNPLLPNGTAALIEGQYINSYSIGLHKGSQKALIQVKPVTIVRDTDRNNKLSFKGEIQTGLFGINIHRALSSGSTQFIDRFSAGCQVFQNADDFEYFLDLCEKHRSLYSNQFTYTLIDKRLNFQGLLIGLLGFISLSSFTGLLTFKNKTDEK